MRLRHAAISFCSMTWRDFHPNKDLPRRLVPLGETSRPSRNLPHFLGRSSALINVNTYLSVDRIRILDIALELACKGPQERGVYPPLI